MASVNLPQGNVFFGWADFQGRRLPVTISMEWMRVFYDLVARVGGATGSPVSDDAIAEAMMPRGDSGAEAMRAIDDLRHELASTRGDLRAALSRIEDLEAQAESRPSYDLRARVEEIEGRLN
jgi:hypothetical protein